MTSLGGLILEKQKILLIVAIILLIGVVMVLSGYILGLNQQPKVNNSSSNNTTVTNSSNVTNNTNSSLNEESNYIGKAAAKQKTIEFLTEYGGMETIEIRSIDFVTINGVPLTE